MQNKSKKIILAAVLTASLVTAGLTGCKTEDRSAGRYLDDRLVARRIESNLSHDPVYKFSDVKVNVFDGVAQLSGFVDTRDQIKIAANLAARAEGVREVVNDIAIKPQFKLVPTGSETGRQYEHDPNWKDHDKDRIYNENSGTYTTPPRAPIVTPNQNVTPQNPPADTDRK